MNERNTPGGEIEAVRRIALADIPDGGAIGVQLPSSTGGFEVVLVRDGARVFGYHNECPHAGRRLDWAPGRFIVDKGHLVCAAHGAQFRVDGGQCVAGPCLGAGLVPIALRIEHDAVVFGQ